MALISCYECKKQISSAANSCPRCGAPKKAPKRASGGAYNHEESLKRFKEACERTDLVGRNVPKCPICSSVALTKLNPLLGGLKGGITGIAKRHECDSCGHMF